MERFAEGLQGLGGLAVAVGLFAWLAWPVALLVLGVLALACGVVLEIGTRPRTVPGPQVLTAEQRRVATLAEMHASGR